MSHPNDAILEEMQDLVRQKKAIEARLDVLSKELTCEVCDGREEVAVRLVAIDRPICKPICKHCFDAWYHGGGLSHEAIRAASLLRQGRP